MRVCACVCVCCCLCFVLRERTNYFLIIIIINCRRILAISPPSSIIHNHALSLCVCAFDICCVMIMSLRRYDETRPSRACDYAT